MAVNFDDYSNYNSGAGIDSVVFGAESPVLEVELNELQEILKTKRKTLLNSLIPSGKFGVNSKSHFTYTGNVLAVSSGVTFFVNGNMLTLNRELFPIVALGETLYLHVGTRTVTKDDSLLQDGYYVPAQAIPSTSNIVVTNYLEDSRYGQETTRRKVVNFYLTSTSTSGYSDSIYTEKSTFSVLTLPSTEGGSMTLSNSMVVLDLSDVEALQSLQAEVDSLSTAVAGIVGKYVGIDGILTDFNTVYAVDPVAGETTFKTYSFYSGTLNQPNYNEAGICLLMREGTITGKSYYRVTQIAFNVYGAIYIRSRTTSSDSTNRRWGNKIENFNFIKEYLGDNILANNTLRAGIHAEFNTSTSLDPTSAWSEDQVETGTSTFGNTGYITSLYSSSNPDFSEIYSKRTIVNVTDEGEIVAVQGDSNFSVTGKATSTYQVMGRMVSEGENVQIMVFQPKYYRKRELVYDGFTHMNIITVDGNTRRPYGYAVYKFKESLSSIPQAGYKIHPAFLDKNGNELDGYLIGVYHSILQDNSDNYITNYSAGTAIANTSKLCSVSGKPVIGNVTEFNATDSVLTLSGLRTLAFNRGSGFQLMDYEILCSELLLASIYIKALDPRQSGVWGNDPVYAKGYTDTFDSITPWNQKSVDGSEVGISSEYGLVRYSTSDYTHWVPSIGGVLNLWGNVATVIDGVSKQGTDNHLFLHKGPIVSSETYTQLLGTDSGVTIDDAVIYDGTETGKGTFCLAYSKKADWIYLGAVPYNYSELSGSEFIYGRNVPHILSSGTHHWDCCNFTYGFPSYYDGATGFTELPDNLMFLLNHDIRNTIASDDSVIKNLTGARLCYRGEIQWLAFPHSADDPTLT